ncbi:MAG TPA: hypothetical protein VFQ53_37070 [Kofleriaceae bacterium]|nr:hypothetical protein [Kofleriaceae bacterium]
MRDIAKPPAVDHAAEPQPSTMEHETAEQQRGRLFAVEGFQQAAAFSLKGMEEGLKRAQVRIEVPEALQKSSSWQQLLGMAVSAIFAGSAGVVGAWVGGKIANKLAQKWAADAVKDVVKQSLHAGSALQVKDLHDLKEAFRQQCDLELATSYGRFTQNWARTAELLYRLPPEELQRQTEILADVAAYDELARQVEGQAVVGWTNFLARAVHGGMRGWDPWAANGGGGPVRGGRPIPLQGAAQNPYMQPEGERVDPMLDNVDASSKLWWALDEHQRPMRDEHYGLLEIHLWGNGMLNTEAGYGMRLDNVGPKVRERIRTMGRVRDARINKIVRVSIDNSQQLDPPLTDAAFLITADGYIRLTNWTRPMDQLVPTAERAQNLSLEHLKA